VAGQQGDLLVEDRDDVDEDPWDRQKRTPRLEQQKGGHIARSGPHGLVGGDVILV
jgi:hypothetical protein